MNIQQLNPWNWFKHEQSGVAGAQVPVRKSESGSSLSAANETFHPMFRLHREIDRLFDDVFSGFGLPGLSQTMGKGVFDWEGMAGYQPQINVSGSDNSYEIELEVPGLSEQDISVEVQGDMLLIKGEKQEQDENKDKHFYRVERRYGRFQRTLSLPQDANADDITATLKNGVLRLGISRRAVEQQDVKKIDIH